MYQALLQDKLEAQHTSGQYRHFTTLNSICARYPMAHLADNDDSEVVELGAVMITLTCPNTKTTAWFTEYDVNLVI
ncbi:hypothetical protein [Pseudomonas sp. B21-048]|uniref:hypothetical protein n=1 Tax=Pseudomonas sp. B21-048 TaxID=2895490 RepID=UPI00216005B3|nr:hypothetical protein [Pseudomonas sp. B21-048]UVL00751.1 hypothetical protein LOY56_10510 [Pseudomonas sp. B21-048]